MSKARGNKQDSPISAEAAMAGILALLVEARERAVAGDKDAAKTEIILANAGMPIGDIAAVTGKKYNAVGMTISRAKQKK